MTIADEYYADAGETVGQAVKRLHADGFSIERASRLIGYATSSDLRKWLDRRGLECPWPKSHAGRGHPPIKIDEKALEQYVELRLAGRTATEASAAVGHTPTQMQSAIYSRRPDLRLAVGGRRARLQTGNQARHRAQGEKG
jgi:AraC-like DNA-binding protein